MQQNRRAASQRWVNSFWRYVLFAAPTTLIISHLYYPTTANATSLTYEFSDASAVLDGDSVSITGTFAFDATTMIETAADITLSGGGFPLDGHYGDYGSAFPYPTGQANHVVGFDAVADYLSMSFSDPLSFQQDPLSFLFIETPGYVEVYPSSVSGSVSPDAIPEPSSLVLLGEALALLLMIAKRMRIRGPILEA